LERSPESIEFEYLWRQLRKEGELIPAKEDLTPVLFKNLLPSMALIEDNTADNTALVRLAVTKMRDIFGREMTGLDYNKFHKNSSTEKSIKQFRGYHDHPFG
jgi:hypothetical protein